MADTQDLVWFADDHRRYPNLRVAGWLAALTASPGVVALCANGSNAHSALAAAILLLGLLGLVGAFVLIDFLYEARAVIEVRLAPGEVVVSRANGSRATYPATALRRVEVTRGEGRAGAFLRMRLGFAERVERTRNGRADEPDKWAEALTVLEVDITVRDDD